MAKRVGAVLLGLGWSLGSHFLNHNGWGLALVEGLIWSLGYNLLLNYRDRGDDA
jgi:hypothetical protein